MGEQLALEPGWTPAQAEATAAHLAAWLTEQVRSRGGACAVVALSGGIDSAVVAALCARGLGPSAVRTLALPIHSLPEDTEDALLVARTLGVAVRVIELERAYEAMLDALGADVRGHALAAANVRPRLRMTALYAEAASHGGIVVGTGNRDELTVGYFTKYGDGGVDLLPLGNLTKGGVRAVARVLGVPQRILDRTPTAGLWRGQTDEAELGFTYADLDRYLTTGEASDVLRQMVDERRRAHAHKLEMPPIAPLPDGIAGVPARGD